jgi:hypothetical protein
MQPCTGTLVVHEDGTPALCSEELRGGRCPDHGYERHRAFEPCRLTSEHGCPRCRDLVRIG